jgi:hypothetical protein
LGDRRWQKEQDDPLYLCGKDLHLSYCDATVKPQSYPDLQHRRFDTHKGEDPFEYLVEFIESEFPE